MQSKHPNAYMHACDMFSHAQTKVMLMRGASEHIDSGGTCPFHPRTSAKNHALPQHEDYVAGLSPSHPRKRKQQQGSRPKEKE